VFAASSLTDALEELGPAYEAESGDRIVLAFGASSDLSRQIGSGAPADVFFSADEARMRELEHAGAVEPGTRRNVLSNVLVVVVPERSELRLAGPRDLLSLGRLALADPDSVPAGVYAKAYLVGQGLWAELAPRIVPVIDVRAALAAVESANVGAGIVYRTDAAISPRVRIAFEVPPAQGPRIVYTLAPLKTSRKAGARGLAAFLASPRAARVYERFGFLVLDAN
jgi:molybdate transport system substrate-binding protein